MGKIFLSIFTSFLILSMIFSNDTETAYAASYNYSNDTKPLTVNQVSNKTTYVTGKTEAKANVEVKIGSKLLGKATADSKGNYKVKIKTQKAGAKLTVIARDRAKNAKTVKVTIADKIAPKTLTVSKVTNKTITVTGKTEAKASVEVKLGSKLLGKATADSKGNYKVKIKVQKAGTKLTVVARDRAKNAKTVQVTIGDKIAPKTLTVSKVTNKTTYVTGKTEAKATVEVKLGSKLLGKATADSKGNYKVKIGVQKKGTKLTVIAKDKAGNARKVTVTVYGAPKPLNVSKTVEKDGIKFDVTFSSKDFIPNGELTVKIKATNISEEAIPYITLNGCDRGVKANIFADDNGQVFTGSQKPLSCILPVNHHTLAPGETIEATQEFYLPTNGLNEHVYAKVTFQKIIDTDARKPMSPIEVQIDIDGFQDDEPFTLVNKSELSVEQKLFIEKWKRTKGVYRLDDLYVIAAGRQPNPGYGLEIVKTETSWEQVTVYVQVTKPKPGDSHIQVISYPYIIGKMNLAPYTSLRFVDAGTGETIPVTKSGLNDE